MCVHGGLAKPVVVNARVLVSGQPTVSVGRPWAVLGCVSLPPCVQGTWAVGAVRVLAQGAPLVVQGVQGVAVPSGTVSLVATQTRVCAQ